MCDAGANTSAPAAPGSGDSSQAGSRRISSFMVCGTRFDVGCGLQSTKWAECSTCSRAGAGRCWVLPACLYVSRVPPPPWPGSSEPPSAVAAPLAPPRRRRLSASNSDHTQAREMRRPSVWRGCAQLSRVPGRRASHPPTSQVDSRYQLVKPIGHGAYGVVCSAIDQTTGEKVAIKKINKAFEHLTDTKRTLREIKILRHFNHENVIRIKVR